MIDETPAAVTAFIRRSVDFAADGSRAGIQELGGKGRSLAELSSTFPVPEWFVLVPAAFEASLGSQLRDALASGDAPAGLLQELEPSPDVQRQLDAAVRQLRPQGGFVAVRSSAADEDSAQSSFAGQLESYLFVTPALVAQRVADVWRSAFGERVMTYRRERGLSGSHAAPAVIVQRMIDADVSGVAFSADPVSGQRDVAVVGALYGLGTALVSGECDADTFHVNGQGVIVGRQIADKQVAHQAAVDSGEGVASVPVAPDKATRPALDDDQVRAVASLARRAQRHFGTPQDIEWAMRGDELFLLQSRPITTLSSAKPPAGALNIWDNSNIAESYGGVTTPLTFSFARHAYDGAYRQFCRLMRISEAAIAEHDDTFRHMLGLIQGRVYYNLLNWYRVLALLPGYRLNRRFMEQMMGVKEPLPDGVLETPREATSSQRLREWGNVLAVALAFVGHYLSLRRRSDRFYAWLRETLGARRPDYAAKTPDELVAEYRRLERRLINRWDAPLINDLFAMIFFGTLRALCTTWCEDAHGTLQNGLVSGEGGMVSAQPAKLVRQMARLAAQDPSIAAAMSDQPLPEALAAVGRMPELDKLFREYLETFGDRTTDELKLESPTLQEDPLMLVRSIGRLAQRVTDPLGTLEQADSTQTPRAMAERQTAVALRDHPLRRLIFAWVLRNARERIVARENLRFERTRLFGRVRSIFAELGRKFAAAGILADARDIFYLEIEEALGYVEGTATCTDLGALASLRRTEFDRYRLLPAPPDRFETRGMASRSAPAPATARQESDVRRTGLGCCPGVVRGRARVVIDPRNAMLRVGEILVAERTDPGWVMLFPAAAGLLVERGSLLSHSAIVAREMRIPAVVALPGVTTWLKDGDWVELDGSLGTAIKIEAPEGTQGARA